jgi:CheY-like chemotaxis protein
LDTGSLPGQTGTSQARSRGSAVTGQSVLVVDDERYIVDLLTDLLESEGYDVRRAYDGLTALEEVAKAAPDLVITDVMMPRLDGLTLIRRLRQHNINLPIVLMSAAVTDPAQLNVPFVAKPFDIDDLLAVVARALNHTVDG